MKRLLIPILIFSILICGCESVKTYYLDSEKLPAEKDSGHEVGVVRIIGVFLKSGGYLDVRDKNTELISKGESRGITYDGQDSKRNHIALDSISVLKIEVARNNYWMPLAIVGGVIALVIILLLIFQPPLFEGYNLGG